MPIFTVVDIDKKLFDAAYPLVRTVEPEVSPEQWSRYAYKVCLRGGLLGLVGADGALFGFATYRVEESLGRGRFFVIDDFVTLELHRAAPGRHALCNAVEVLARDQSCTAIEVRLEGRGFSDHAAARTQGWMNLGYSLTAVVFVKFLAAANHADSPVEALSVAEA